MFKRKALFTVIALTPFYTYAQIEEVIVTATKREASTQDIPVAISTLGQEGLQQLGITGFTDYLIQMPGVTSGGAGPGQNTIYIRGIASTTPNLTTSGTAGLAPNVALYLDEQPLAQPGRNLDVYAADLSRIEVLKGPQGTLFGASSQAGTVRLITNKPDPSGFYGKLKAGVATTSGGAPSNNLEVMINMPINDDLTLRGVVYRDKQGGYIDNVAGTRTTQESARFQTGGFQAASDLSGVNFLEANNQNLVEKDFNEASYQGGRISALWAINEDWDLLVAASTQTIESDGVFFQDPELGDLEIQRYEADTLEDEFVNVNWTLTGRVGALEAVYTGAFTEREAEQRVDYTDYLFAGQYIPYYICDSSVSYPSDVPSGTCQAPNLYVDSYVKSEVSTHELRFSTPQENAIRSTFGAFYSSMELREDAKFTYPGSEFVVAGNGNIGFGPNYSAQGSSVRDTSLWAKGIVFRNDVLRTDDQKAVFGEVEFDILDDFTLTLGARWYDIEVDLKGSASGSFGNLGATVDNNAGNNLDQLFSGANDTASTDGVIGKASLSWTPDDNQLYYVTWSEGFRPGYLNRPGGRQSQDGSYTVPFTFDSDDVVNFEFGWKLDLLDNTLRINGDVFFVEVTQMQVGIFDPNIANLFFSDNAADAEITGLEADFIWAPESVPGLTVSGAISLLDTEITDSFVTQFVQVGDELAFAPKLQGNLQARYVWDLSDDYSAHAMVTGSYSDDANTDIVVSNRTYIDSWTMIGLSTGISTEEWDAVLYVDNITDERAELSGNAIFNRDRINVSRPRTMGLRFSYNF